MNKGQVESKLFDRFMGIFSYLLLGFVLAYLLYSILTYVFPAHLSNNTFGMIVQLRMPAFADLRWITATSGCNIDINDIYTGKSVGCDSFGRVGIGYPPMSLWAASFLRMKGDHTPLISVTLFLSFIGVVLSQMRSSVRPGWLLILVGSLFLISFPTQLGLERMNLDVVIFLLLYLISLLFSLQALAWLVPLMIFIIALKYYPFFAFFGLILKGMPAKPGISYLLPPSLILLIASCIGLALSLPWANSKSASIVAAGGLGSHGLMAMGYVNNTLIDAFGLTSARWLIKLILAVKLIMFASGAFMASRLKLSDVLAKAMYTQSFQFNGTRLPADFFLNLLVSTTSTWLGCYIIMISFDYRMIFLFPALILIARAIQLCPSIRTGIFQRSGLICLLIAMLGSMLIPFIGYAFQAQITRLGIDAISEFILIPFYASALFVIILAQILAARRSSGMQLLP